MLLKRLVVPLAAVVALAGWAVADGPQASHEGKAPVSKPKNPAVDAAAARRPVVGKRQRVRQAHPQRPALAARCHPAAPPAPAALPAPALSDGASAPSGMVVSIDPGSGKLMMPSPEDLRGLDPTALGGPSLPSDEPLEVKYPDGHRLLYLGNRGRDYVMAFRGPDGKLRFICTPDPPVPTASPTYDALPER